MLDGYSSLLSVCLSGEVTPLLLRNALHRNVQTYTKQDILNIADHPSSRNNLATFTESMQTLQFFFK